MMNKQTLFSGLKPTGELHIGNFLGTIKHWIDLQNEYNSIFSIVDYHSLTVDFNPQEKREQIFNMAVDTLACGIDPKKAIFFIQSQLPEHTELAWILNCITPVAELQRMTQYKDKSQKQKHNINMGLLDYPVLMAADVLLYKAEVVPVGNDQLQHIELTKKIAKKFNNKFGGQTGHNLNANQDKDGYFPIPEAKLTKTPRIMSLNNPQKKMSKSLGKSSYIALSDTPDIIKEKISKAVSDTGKSTKRIGGGRNLLDIFAAFVDDENIVNKFEEDYKKGELQYSKFKPMLANVIISSLKPIQQKRQKLLQDKKYVEQVLKDGSAKAKEIASKNLSEIKKLIGVL